MSDSQYQTVQLDDGWWVIEQATKAKINGPWPSEATAIVNIPGRAAYTPKPGSIEFKPGDTLAPQPTLSAGTGVSQPGPSAKQTVAIPAPTTDRRAESSGTRSAPLIISMTVIVMFLLLVLVMAFHASPTDNKDMLNTLLGVLGAAFTLVLNYWFGTNSSSRQKDSTIAQLSK